MHWSRSAASRDVCGSVTVAKYALHAPVALPLHALVALNVSTSAPLHDEP